MEKYFFKDFKRSALDWRITLKLNMAVKISLILTIDIAKVYNCIKLKR